MQSDSFLKLQSLSETEVALQQSEIESFLTRRSIELRFAAAEALGRARVGARALRARLGQEKSDLVLSALCEALAANQDIESLPHLRGLAHKHKSPLVRGSAILAIAEMEGRTVLRFLKHLQRDERSRRVRVSIHWALCHLGEDAFLPHLLAGLRSRDYIVRCQTANRLAESPLDSDRTTIQTALEEALAIEARVPVADALRRALGKTK